MITAGPQHIDITRRPVTATLHCHHCGDVVTAAYELSNAVKFQKQLAAGDLTCGVCDSPLQATPRRIILLTDDYPRAGDDVPHSDLVLP